MVLTAAGSATDTGMLIVDPDWRVSLPLSVSAARPRMRVSPEWMVAPVRMVTGAAREPVPERVAPE